MLESKKLHSSSLILHYQVHGHILKQGTYKITLEL